MKTKISFQEIGLVLILLLLPLVKGACQTDPGDSLISLLKIKWGSERIDILYELSRKYGDQDYQKAFNYAAEGFAMANQVGDTARIVKLGRTKAQIFRRLGEIDSASTLFYQLIPIATRHNLSSELASILNGLGNLYTYVSEYDKALKHLFDALAIREKENNIFYICGVLNNIGVVYSSLSDFEKALSFYLRAVHLKKSVHDESELDLFYSNIGLCYSYMKDFNKAQIYIDNATRICKGNCSKRILAYTSFSRGIISFHQRNFLNAESKFLDAYRLSIETDDKRHRLIAIEYLLQIYTEENRFAEAEKYLKDAVAIVSAGSRLNESLSNIYYQAIKLFKKTKRFGKMSTYQDKYIALRDQILNEKAVANLMKIEAEHLEKEYMEKIESQNKILALNNEVIRTQKFLNIFIGAVALLLIILIAVLIKSIRLKQRHNILLDKKVQERTHQLQLNHEVLQRSSLEREILLEKISADVTHALATLRGLCLLGLKDVQDPHALQYISKMNTASESFSNIITKLKFIRSGGSLMR